MPRGPLPKPESRRRNAPTIPTTALPAAGRSGPTPKIPANVGLAKSGRAWWRWAWSTPQAAAWDSGSVQLVARRASLEDDLRVLDDADSLDLGEVLDAKTAAEVRSVVGRLAALATGRLSVIKEMRETDRLLGLTPKSLAELRWKITDADEESGPPQLGVVQPTPIRPRDGQDPRQLLA